MGYKDDNYSTKVCGHHPETCTCRDWDTKEERERGFTITNVDKQETLEEFLPKNSNGMYSRNETEKAFELGAKWQQERMYSEEEVLELLLNRPGPYLSDEEIKEWFEENKKK